MNIRMYQFFSMCQHSIPDVENINKKYFTSDKKIEIIFLNESMYFSKNMGKNEKIVSQNTILWNYYDNSMQIKLR